MKFDAATRWGRNVLAAIVAMALLTMLAMGVTILRKAANNRSGASPATAPLTIRVTVNPGESLWSLSQRYGNPNIGIQDRVDALAQANGLGAGTSLVAGQRLLVPVSNPMELARLQTHLASAH
jgi:hypothetical protein